MKPVYVFLAALAVAVPAASLPSERSAFAAAMSDSHFVSTAGVAGMFEIQSSQLAADHAQNADVKAFAQRMITDHTAAAKELEATVTSEGDKTPVPKDLDAKHKKMIDELSKLNGAQFDKLYVQMQVRAHKEAVDLFSGFSKRGHDEKLRAFAAKTLPTLEDHYKHIKMISSSKV